MSPRGMGRLLVWPLAMGLAGCARFPDVAQPVGTRLIFTMTLAAPLRTGAGAGDNGIPYIYMVAMRPSEDPNPTTGGPIPVVAPPWGNGFVAGGCTHFVWWDPTQASEFTIYQFRDPDLQQWFALGVPVNVELIRPGAARLRFELDLRQLAPSLEDSRRFQSLQVNFLTMDRVPISGSSKFWDALGDGRLPGEVNQFVTIPLRSSGTFDNRRAGDLEPPGDTLDPALDMIDWSVEVRLQ